MKIDNSPLARPYHRGLDEASLVYQELMEGGATRFLAVYAPGHGTEVGPIRSMRESDIELLQQFGKIALAASGGNTGVLATVDAGRGDGQLLDVNFDERARALPPGRAAQGRHQLLRRARRPSTPAKPGGDLAERHRPALRPAAAAATSRRSRAPRVAFSPISRTTVRARRRRPAATRVFSEGGAACNGAAPGQRRRAAGADPAEPATSTSLGNRTPFTETVGSGPVDVLRDGLRLSRHVDAGPTPLGGTRFVDAAGADLPLKPGPTWLLLVPAGGPLAVG